ncbi:MAG: hypothetical protein QXQ57_07675 [Sulfolobales archaeon]
MGAKTEAKCRCSPIELILEPVEILKGISGGRLDESWALSILVLAILRKMLLEGL